MLYSKIIQYKINWNCSVAIIATQQLNYNSFMAWKELYSSMKNTISPSTDS